MPLNLTPKEQHLLAVVLSKQSAIPTVDWEEVAPLVGQKYARNARTSFNKVWEKLKAPDGGDGVSASDSNDGKDDNKSSPSKSKSSPKTPKKSTPRKVVGSSGPRKSPLKKVEPQPKKEEEDEDEDFTDVPEDVLESMLKYETEGDYN